MLAVRATLLMISCETEWKTSAANTQCIRSNIPNSPNSTSLTTALHGSDMGSELLRRSTMFRNMAYCDKLSKIDDGINDSCYLRLWIPSTTSAPAHMLVPRFVPGWGVKRGPYIVVAEGGSQTVCHQVPPSHGTVCGGMAHATQRHPLMTKSASVTTQNVY